MNQITIKLNNKQYSVYVRDEADASVIAEIFKIKEYRIAENIIKNLTDPIIDVGAHAGFFSVYSHSLNPGVRIIAVEPEKANLQILRRHLEENNLSKIETVDAALAGQTGERQLFLSKDSHNHYLLGKNEASAYSKMVFALSLPDLLKKCKISRIGLLKLDIEGGEYELFDSLTPSEFRIINSIIMEYHNNSENNYKIIEEKLRQNGFGVQIYPSKFDKSMGFLFGINKRKIK